MTTRLEIAIALTGSEVVAGTEFRPNVINAGCAWAQMASKDRDAGSAYITTWSIWVILPGDEPAAAAWLDTNFDAIDDALRAVVFVDRLEIVSVPEGLFAALITARSE